MDPVIGLDVAQGKSQVQAFLQKKKPYKKSFVFDHNVLGLHDFYRFYQEVEEAAGLPPVVVFEDIIMNLFYSSYRTIKLFTI
ncbi:hypothetical protein ACE1TI_20910 [Alteribacillus sp. JSM 102045]|uniref:hypothetical protein n=1 Tax=Alteribacillus sp. JSM 102045 TaxID=1562101 RepID=UPI0035C00056